MARIELRTEIAAPIEAVFDLARSIDAHLGSMERSRERAVGGVTSGLIGPGQQVTWKATHFGIPFTMTSEIVAMDRPVVFVDQQTRGPFRSFRHEHRFEVVDGLTVMHDSIAFASPLGPIGRLVERLGLERYMTSLIRERNAFLTATLEGPTGAP